MSLPTFSQKLSNDGNIYSINFLNDLLKQQKTLSINAEAELSLIEKTSETNTNLKSDYAYAEDFVICGQAINLYTLQNIFREYFLSHACSLVISSHPLNMQFSRQVLNVTVFHNNAKKLITTQFNLSLSKSYFLDCFNVSEVKVSVPGVLVMDMDSTIIDMECIDEIAALNNRGEQVAALTERAMQGELDFNQSLVARVSCLKGIELNQLEALRSRLPVNPGFAATISYLQEKGWVTCIASGGFTYFADYLKTSFNLNKAVSNVLTVADNKLVGKVEGDIVNAETKKQVLLDCMKHHNLNQSIAIGDGANDLVMMEAASLGVAYKAKAKVQAAADANIHYCGFEGLLYALKY